MLNKYKYINHTKSFFILQLFKFYNQFYNLIIFLIYYYLTTITIFHYYTSSVLFNLLFLIIIKLNQNILKIIKTKIKSASPSRVKYYIRNNYYANLPFRCFL